MSAHDSAPPASPLHSELYGHYVALRDKGDLLEPTILRLGELAKTPIPTLDVLWQRDPRGFVRTLGEIAQKQAMLPLVQPTVEGVSALKMRGYPHVLQAGAGSAAVQRSLERTRASEFSFMALGEDSQGTPCYAACALAYQESSSVPPALEMPVLHIGDLVVARECRDSPLAIRICHEMLVRAVVAGFTAAEIDARGATTYKFLQSGGLIASWGLRIVARGRPEAIGSGDAMETIYPVRLAAQQ